MAFRTAAEIIQIIISCLICGSVEHKATKLCQALQSINTRALTDAEYREWRTFTTVVQQSGRSFGFTIGGFAPFNKRTLIAIFTFMLNYSFT
ncbi:unnamed protein product [Medioppia subpectinata]|uniref:Uncharacterized protein n=1 Tax=Medioppia subpectinata TaxID=1979941 RepID=A0A7R9KHB5_9ACAR|nr:unnamed protein product [Medioppia subpectinata]CAG2103335.1 unnamed protein product [Medioppia subpectinata]